ncbi:hypothetical protein ACIQMY_20605 [Streptomyces sp. NPDC091368]|uniref:hypothetical protein n=1 Tax=Streptomyces sp. NPDC091368 TaxID=3365993 RepID=UPI003830EC69
MLPEILQAVAAAAPAPSQASTPPWWGAALGAGVGALGAGIVSSVVALINNRANRKQLRQQLDAQQQMLDKQLEAQREQLTAQLSAQQTQSRDSIAAQLQVAGMNNEANHARDREEQRSELRKWELETRRQAYVDFVVAVERLRDTVRAIGELLAGSWPLPQALTDSELRELVTVEERIVSEYELAFQRAQVVRLTGPALVANQAQSLGVTLTEYVSFSKERFRAARRNERSDTLKEWNEAVKGMDAQLQEFIASAYGVVGQAGNGTEAPVPVQGTPSVAPALN